MSDSHTAFNSTGFTAGAFGGALTVAGALVAGMQAAAGGNGRRWDRWNRHQLETALELSEALRAHAVARAEQAEAERDKLKRLALKRAVRARK